MLYLDTVYTLQKHTINYVHSTIVNFSICSIVSVYLVSKTNLCSYIFLVRVRLIHIILYILTLNIIGAIIESNLSCIHGICVFNNTHTCDCFKGWTGSYCDQGIVTSYSIHEKNGINKLQEKEMFVFHLPCFVVFTAP